MRYITDSETSLLEVLKKNFPDSSTNTLRSWIKQGRIQVDGIPIKKGSTQLTKGQEVTLSSRKKWVEGGIEILFEDQDIVVIHKPCGLLSVATDIEKEETAHAYLKNYYNPRRVFVVHRLDQDTSGVMLFALNEPAMEKLKKTFEKHEIERRYVAIVEGAFEEDQGTWQSHLYEDLRYVMHSTEIPEKGELAITHYQLMDKTTRYSWLDCRLETGKKNQIRVHCQDAGHPVVGDKKYGSELNPVKRLCLHARLLDFAHPVSGKQMHFEVPVPEDFYRLIPRR